MNWIRQNKFLAGFIAVMVIGVGVLGYLAYSAYSSFSDISDTYTAQSTELHRLVTLNPYPDEANLKKMRDQKDAYRAAINALQKELASHQLPIEQLSPAEFQDRLRVAVADTTTKAQQQGVKLPDKFYLGFERYQTELPGAQAASVLGHQLKAIQMVVNNMIDNRVDAITSLARAPLTEESGGPAQPQAQPPGPHFPGGQSKATNTVPLVTKRPFEIAFTTDQTRFRNVFNYISTAKEQFFVVRSLVVKNQNPKGPARGGDKTGLDAVPTPVPVAAPGITAVPGADATAAATPSMKFILGTEKLDLALRIEVVDFATSLPK